MPYIYGMSMIEGIIDEHAPWIEKRVKHATQPERMSEDILDAIDKKGMYVKQKDHENYKLWRNKLLSLIRIAKSDYYITLIEYSKFDSKTFWKHFREIDPKPSSPPPTSLNNGDSKLYNSDEIETAFNEVFINIVTNYLPPRNETFWKHELSFM